MGLLDEICEKRSRLCHTTTVVTTADGKVYQEEYSTGGFRVLEHLNSSSSQNPGFVVDLKPDLQVAEVMSGLCFGSQDVSQEVAILHQYKVTDIISLGVDVPHLDSLPVCYHFVPVLDLPETQLVCVLDRVLPLMHDLLRREKVVYIHCNAGVSRSPTIVIAYLMRFKGMRFQDAFDLVRQKRPTIKPNPSFVEQLKEFETLCGSK